MVTYSFFAVVVGLVAVERIVELVISGRNARRALAAGAREVGRGHYRVMAVMHAAFLVACLAEPLLFARVASPAVAVAALAGALCAQALRYWAIATLGPRWSTRIIVLPDVWPDAAPVRSGPYRFVRHPNYVAVCLELLCLPLVGGAWLTALAFSLVNAAVLFVRVRAEEAALGDGYARAFAATPRFLPGRSHD